MNSFKKFIYLIITIKFLAYEININKVYNDYNYNLFLLMNYLLYYL